MRAPRHASSRRLLAASVPSRVSPFAASRQHDTSPVTLESPERPCYGLGMPSFALTLAVAAGSFARPDMLVTTDWLARHLDDRNVRVVAFATNRDLYAKGHIPGAVFLANDALRVRDNAPTFLPTAEAFAKAMGELGITNTTRVIAYDERGGLYAARLWYTMKIFGHDNVALLDGHLTKWSLEGRALSTAEPTVTPTTFKAGAANLAWVATAEQVVKAIDAAGSRILDARTQGEIEGRDLRNIKRGGNIPSSTPLYWEDLMDPKTKALRPPDELQALMASKGLKSSDEMIVYCQVGMRASYDVFVLHLLGFDKVRNYYGAWEEWGNRDDLPLRVFNSAR